jgi:6-phosphogluconolactonase
LDKRINVFALNLFMTTKHQKPCVFNLLIGTYTADHTEGISVCRFDAETGRLAYLNGVEGVSNPSYLCIAGNGRLVYAVNEESYDKAGAVSALSFNPTTGTLTLINQEETGRGPCYVSVDKMLRHAFVANYAEGSLSVFPLGEDGRLLPVIQKVQYEGCGPDEERQEQPHVHAAVLSPDGQYVWCTDLGTDQIYQYRYQPFESPPLRMAGSPLRTLPGHGPRHIGFSSDGKFMYLVTEMGGTIYVYHYDGEQCTTIQTISLLADGFQGMAGGGDVQVSPDGRYLYASNRGDANEIVVFAIDGKTGRLSFVERKPSLGKSPRNLAIDPSGSFLLIANQNSNNVIVYHIHKQTGKLTATDSKVDISNPCCLQFYLSK